MPRIVDTGQPHVHSIHNTVTLQVIDKGCFPRLSRLNREVGVARTPTERFKQKAEESFILLVVWCRRK